MKNLKWIVIVLIGLGILALLILVYIAATRDLSGLESVLLQIILLAIGSGISFFAGHRLAQRQRSYTPDLRSGAFFLFMKVSLEQQL